MMQHTGLMSKAYCKADLEERFQVSAEQLLSVERLMSNGEVE